MMFLTPNIYLKKFEIIFSNSLQLLNYIFQQIIVSLTFLKLHICYIYYVQFFKTLLLAGV